ncbi:MAG: GAF domain-containing protein [Chloroflexi bacterium]|nr:GAF domain-containing protein [Chloroflexota bacterium]
MSLRRLRFNNWPLSTKLTAIFLLIVVLPALLFLIPFNSYRQTQFAEQQNEVRLETLGPLEIAQAEETLRTLTNEVGLFANDPADYEQLEEYLYLARWSISEDTRQVLERFVENKITRFMRSAPSVSRIRFYATSGDLLVEAVPQGSEVGFTYNPTTVIPTPADTLIQNRETGVRVTLGDIYLDSANIASIDAVYTLRPLFDTEGRGSVAGHIVVTQDLIRATEDRRLPDLYAALQEFPKSKETTHVYLLDWQGRLVSPAAKVPMLADMSDSEGFVLARRGKTGVSTYHSPLLATEVMGYHTTLTLTDGPRITLLIETPVSEIYDQTRREGLMIAVISGIIALLLGGAALMAATLLITRPIAQLTEAARQIATGRLNIHLPRRERQDEIGVLGNTLGDMAGQLIDAISELETRVAERTHNLEATLSIGQVLTSIRDLDSLLQEVVNLLQESFEKIYHVQVFMIDPRTNRAILRASTGEIGRQLLERGHYLDIGSQSVIGSVTASGHAVVASDTSNNPIHKRNEFLPDTLAEMALPLRLGDKVIGALDLQSKQAGAFIEQDVELFQGMADQLTIAIDNAILFDESNARLKEIERLNRSLTEAAWRDTEQQRDPSTLSAASGLLPAAEVNWSELQLEAMRTHQLMERVEGATITLAVPVVLRDQTLGAVEWQIPKDRYTSDTRQMAQALTTRLALTAENIRLFEQTQRALNETEQLYETARAVSSAPELNTIYQLVVEQLSASPTVDNVEILLSGPDPSLVQYLENAYSWNRHDQPGRPITRERVRVMPLVLAQEDLLLSDMPILYTDALNEISRDHPLYEKIRTLSGRSVALAPLSAAGRWFGLLLCSSQRPDGFQPAYMTLISTLADQLAIAIENRRLFDEVQVEARRARALAEAGQLASQIGGNYEAGLHNLFQAVSGPGNYDRWWFGQIVEDGTVLQRLVSSGMDILDRVNIQDDQNALAETARISEMVLVNDPIDHPVVGEQSPETTERWGKHMTMPVKIGETLVGVLLIGRSLEEQNLDERDLQLAATLASQVAVATQNRRLFNEAESQRQNLQTIVNTMPTGILVMDRAGQILLSNQRLIELLGPDMRPGTHEHSHTYPIVRAETRESYPRSEWPLSRVFSSGQPEIVDDMVIAHPDGYEISVMAQAAPIRDAAGNITAVVGAFQDITEIQELERALQESLRETTLLYEASRAISRTTSMEDLTTVLMWQINTLEPKQVYVLLASDAAQQGSPKLAACEPSELADGLDLALLRPILSQEVIILDAGESSETAANLSRLGVETLGSFPLIVREQLHGWVVIGYSGLAAIGTERRRFMTTLVDQAAVSIENQRLLMRTAEVLEETSILYHASRVIADARTPAEIMSVFVHQVTPVQVHHAALYMLLGEAETTSYAAVELATSWSGLSGNPPLGTRYRADQFPYWEIMMSSEIVQYHDLSNEAQIADLSPVIRQEFTRLGLGAATLIPLHTAEHPLGVILIGLDMPWPNIQNETRIYQALADQAAVSLENTRLYQQAQRRARQLTTSAEISRAVTSILQLDQLLPQVVDRIREAFEYDHVQVFLISEDRSLAHLVASTGPVGHQLLALRHSLPVGSQSVIGQVTVTGKPQIALDTADARVIHRANPLLPDTRSEMALPLIARGHIVGALDVQSSQPGAFTDDDARMLSSLADMVATAIDNARLFQMSEQHAEEMSFLFRVTTAATASPHLERSLAEAMEILKSTLKVTSASVYLPDQTGEAMFRGAHVGTSSPETEASFISLDRGLVGWVARHNQAVLIDDITQDPRRQPNIGTTRAVMAVPMQTAGTLVGVLMVESDQLRAFSQHDLRLLQTLGGSLAAIIQNSRLLRQVQEAHQRLLEVDQLQKNFLAAMSHELRTPLNSIIGFSRVILKGIDGPLTDTQEQDLTTIYDSGKHLLGLVNDILDQAKIEAQKMELLWGYFKVQDVIESVLSSAKVLTRDKPVRLHTEIAENLPPVYGDDSRTRQILLNLISNAAKFTEEGSITVSAFPIVEHDQPYVQISVSDTGIGIAEKDMIRLFEPFQQADNSLTRKVGGTGLGLPLSKSLVELQYGRIWVETQVNVGSTFSITIPTTPPPDKTAQAGPPDAQRKGTGPLESPSRRKIVLIVEDEVETINLYRRYLSREGYEVLGVTQPEKVANAINIHHPDVILLDVNLHDQEGWNVLSYLKNTSNTADIPVIICSLNQNSQRGYEMGAADYLLKPFSEDQLIQVIYRVLTDFRKNILLVDDKPQTVRAVREVLQTEGQYEVIEATSGQQALEIMQQTIPIDLVILDLRMPELDGFKVLEGLRSREQTANIPVLVLTADEVSGEERAILNSIDIYRKDNLDEKLLLERIAAQLGTIEERR